MGSTFIQLLRFEPDFSGAVKVGQLEAGAGSSALHTLAPSFLPGAWSLDSKSLLTVQRKIFKVPLLENGPTDFLKISQDDISERCASFETTFKKIHPQVRISLTKPDRKWSKVVTQTDLRYVEVWRKPIFETNGQI